MRKTRRVQFIPHTEANRKKMLEAIGVARAEDLFADVPENLRFPTLDLPPALSELEAKTHLSELSRENVDLDRYACFLGAGAYNHFIPSVVGHLAGRSEFYTSYTPYQPEISQGTLQSIFEFQSLTCELLGLEVANASMYDGASAVAEAASMACRITRRDKVLIPTSVHPEYRAVVQTYAQGPELEIVEEPAVGFRPGDTIKKLTAKLDDRTACLVVQQPNFFGHLENLADLAEAAHKVGALLIVVAYPISLGLIKPPGSCGADIAVADGQSLGNALSFGGPSLGLMACRERFLRQLPGRIAGETTDIEGRRGFVLTLQAREQHIRREKASSNICTNEALNALMATIYLSTMGKEGLRQVADLCYHKAHYAARRIGELPGYRLAHEWPFFNEFVVRCPLHPAEINRRLLDDGIVGGYDLGRSYPELADSMIFCVTEMNSRPEIDRLVEALRKIA